MENFVISDGLIIKCSWLLEEENEYLSKMCRLDFSSFLTFYGVHGPGGNLGDSWKTTVM